MMVAQELKPDTELRRVRYHVLHIRSVFESSFHDDESIVEVSPWQDLTPRVVDGMKQVNGLLLVFPLEFVQFFNADNRLDECYKCMFCSGK